MIDALWITAIGMGLVFLAILVLWGVMALLVRITDRPEAAEVEPESEAAETASAETMDASDGALDRKRRAAAVAVAVALSLRKPVRPAREQQAGSVSAWQAVNRASQVSQRAYSSRKKVLR